MIPVIRHRLFRIAVGFTLLLMALLAFPYASVSAHSSLTRAIPAPDSRLEASPPEVTLSFNERIENTGFEVKVYNRQGLPVTESEAVIDKNRKTLTLALPRLEGGGYTVTYRLLSADGHPIKASYVFTVGAMTDANIGYSSAARLHEEHDIGKNAGYWVIRAFYYLALLAATGWAGLQLYAKGLVDENRRKYMQWQKLLLTVLLLAYGLLAWSDYRNLAEEFEASDLTAILTRTSIGISYMLSLVIAVAGYFILGRRKGVDAGWVLLLIAAKGLNGHAMGFAIPIVTFALDVAHLVAASLWAGVLLAFVAFGTRKRSSNAESYYPVLSQTALIAIALLVVSGLTTAILYTDGFKHLLDTWWGRLMLGKAGLVLLVIATGGLIRSQIRKRRRSRLFAWLGVDLVLFVAIIAITGIFTYLNPLAATGPLFWHENVKGVHIAVIITPNEPGSVNQFNVSVGGQAAGGSEKELRKVTLRLHYEDNPDIAPVDVALKEVRTNGSPLSLYDFNYSVEGNYLLFPGKWKLEVRVLNADADEFATEKVFYSEAR